MSKLIIITGPDGAGKSTLCEQLCERLGANAKLVNIWSGLKESPFTASKSSIHSYLEKIDPISRNLLIFHSILAAIHDANHQQYPYILVDGFWYKYAVTEQALSKNKKVFEIAENIFEKPDRVFYLDVSPATALLRKNDVSAYEIGFAQTGDAGTQFITFQNKIHENWSLLIKQHPHWVQINTEAQSIEQTTRQVYHEILA